MSCFSRANHASPFNIYASLLYLPISSSAETWKIFRNMQCQSHFIKAMQNIFPVFAYPDINTRGAGRIRDSYANPRRSRGLMHNCIEFSQPLSCLERFSYDLEMKTREQNRKKDERK